MPKTPDQNPRLVILNKYPEHYAPRFRDILVSDPITTREALALGKKVNEKYYPIGVSGFAFIEGATDPAIVKLDCDTCDSRRQAHDIEYLKFLLGVE